MRASVYIATSLDGFIAREDGAIDWLSSGDAPGDGEDYGYQDFMNTVDALVMGRNTFEKVLTFGGWPYGNKPVVVLSSSQVGIPRKLARSVEYASLSPRELINQLSRRGIKNLYVDGGKTIQGFLRDGLIQQMIITRIPILIGSGIPLFGPLEQDIKLRHMETREFPNGLVQSRYEIAR